MTESGGTNREPSVLVVDDDLTFLGVITEALSPVARCDIAVTGRAALQRMQHSAFDVVLLDLGLPDIGGIEVLRCLRIDRNPVPVVLVSGAGSIASAVAAMKLGAHDFIEKPVVLADLLDIVRSFMPLSSPSSGRSMPVEPGQNLVNTILAVGGAERDTPSVDAWCDLVGMAPATLHSRCARAGVRAKTALDLGRLLRVVSQKPRDQQAVERLLENRDIRSIRALLARSGLRASDLVLLDRTTLLRSQTLTDNQSLISDLIRAISSLDD